jgi:uncharacterized protein
MFKKILVPLDGSEVAEQALAPAVKLSQPGAELLLLCVPSLELIQAAAPEEPLPGAAPDLSPAEAEAYLALLKQLNAQLNCTWQTALADKEEANTIVEAALSAQADLIVMAARGSSGLRRWILGNATEEVLRQAPCPVLVVRASEVPAHVLIALDGSKLTEVVLEPAMKIARQFESRVTLLHVLEGSANLDSLEIGALEWAEGVPPNPGEEPLKQGEAELYLQEVARRLQPEVGQLIKTAVISGAAAQSIVDFAEAEKADLIVVATHDYKGLQRWLHANTPEKILHNTGSGLLVVRLPLMLERRDTMLLNFEVSDETLRQILEESRIIAMVGESNDHYYTSYQVAQYLKEMGYTVYPVNPTIEEVDGDKSYPSLKEVPEPIDIVNVFRAPEFLGEIVDDAIAVKAKILWTQLDVVSIDEKPEQDAVEAGLGLVSNKCIRTEHERLGVGRKQ